MKKNLYWFFTRDLFNSLKQRNIDCRWTCFYNVEMILA